VSFKKVKRLKSTPLKSESERIDESREIIRSIQAQESLNVAIVGGGRACYNLLKLLNEDRLSRLKMKILGISDINPDAPGICYAKELGLFTATNLQELFNLKELNVIIELTGSTKIREEIYREKPSGISVMDHIAARLFWDLIQIEIEKRNWKRSIRNTRRGVKRELR